MKTSKILSLDWRDLVKGLLMAVLTPVVAIIQQSLEAGNWVFDWKTIGLAAVSGGVAYLAKNFFTNQKEVTPIQSIGGTQIPPKNDEK